METIYNLRKKNRIPCCYKTSFRITWRQHIHGHRKRKRVKRYCPKYLCKKLKTSFIIEKQFEGKEYRVFLTKEGNYAVLHREPAHVIGDGEHTILKLIEIENEKRKKKRINCLCPIATDEITKSYMKKKQYFNGIQTSKKRKVYLRHNSNVAKGGLCIDYTDKIHKSVFRKL